MKKRNFPFALILGIAFILVAFFMVIGLQIRVHMGSRKSQDVVAKMDALLPDKSVGILGIYPNTDMPILEIGGVDYVAMLEISSMGVSVPVADQWDNDKLFDSSARFCGSAYDKMLVIGGVDHSHQFAFCDKIDLGTAVVITDMTGAQFTYTVTRVERSKHAENRWLADPAYDLTLFCRDIYSMEYIAVRCDLAHHGS